MQPAKLVTSDSLFVSLGIRSGRAFWSAVVLLLITFLFFGFHSRGLRCDLANTQKKLDDLTEVVRKMSNTQELLSEKISLQNQLLEVFMGAEGKSALPPGISISNQPGQLSIGLSSLASKLDAMHRDIDSLKKKSQL